MSKIELHLALDGAETVRADRFYGETLLQVWRGGHTVNVYRTVSANHVVEVDVWTMYGDNGEAPSEEEVEEHMRMHLNTLEAEYEG